MLEQSGCTYQRIGQSTGPGSAPPAIRLAAFHNPAAAQGQRNLAVEADDTISVRPVAAG